MAENFMRSAKAPQIKAGVMMAKVIWKVMNTDSGIVPFSELMPMPMSRKRELPPRTPLPPVNAQL
jgi:hypothetical protein